MSGLILKPQTAEVFAPLWEQKSRYKGAYGGRGSAKSNDRAQAVILGMVANPGFRVVCVREVQNSIKDSVRQLLVDWIDRMGVRALFDVQETQIKGPGDSLCIFRGMNDQNNDTIKSLEGYHVAWWEEAQTASERSLELLRPTIRAPGSEIWFTWNPRFKTDPVDKFLRQNRPHNAVVVEANYSDNPWFPKELEEERQHDERTLPEDRYRHIWLGHYELTSDRQLISEGSTRAAVDRTVQPEAFDERVMGIDVARFGDDKSVIYFREGRNGAGTNYGLPPYERYSGMDTMQLAARVADWIGRWSPHAVFVDDGGVGGGVVDRLHQLGFTLVQGVNFGAKADSARTGEKASNKRSEMWLVMRKWLDRGSLPDDDALIAELTAPMYSYDAHNRIVLEKKEDMKKRGVPSPDIADALALTFAYPVQGGSDDWYDDSPYELHGRNERTGY